MDRTEGRDRRIAGRYLLLAEIGVGSAGPVWSAQDEVLGREVAVTRVDLPPRSTAAGARQRRLREARAAARVVSPHAVQVFDVIEDGDGAWIVTERRPGRSLAERLAESGPLPPHDVVRLGQHLLLALRAAHEHGVLHRDVTAANVLLRHDGAAVLTDFGLSSVDGDPPRTAAGGGTGAPGHPAPERLAGSPATAGSDLWSMGCVLYAAAYGPWPFHRDDLAATVRAIQYEEPALPSGPLAPVLRGLLAKNPALRVSAETAHLMLLAASAGLAVLDAAPAPTVGVGQGESGRPRGTAGRHRRRPTGRLLTLGAALLVAAAGTATVVRDQPQADVAQTVTPGLIAAAPSTTPPQTSRPAPPTTPSPEPADPTDGAIPAGFRLHVDDSGFSVAVPVGWTVAREGSRTDFVEPGGGRFLRIDQTQTPKPDPVADWQEQEAGVSARLGGYARIRIEPVDYRDYDAADWEFTWQADTVALHVLNRNTITGPDRAYAIYWSTPEEQWVGSLPMFDVIAASFRPAT